MERWLANSDKDIQWIMKENLKKGATGSDGCRLGKEMEPTIRRPVRRSKRLKRQLLPTYSANLRWRLAFKPWIGSTGRGSEA